jgi:16S rRNA (adenine1518-N6/adenine1519-N6)-dimethyltransferase
LTLIEIDRDSIAYLNKHFKDLGERIIEGDFLKINLQNLYASSHLNIIGNFPYNISSQILFKVLEFRGQVDQVVGMIQKEVAQRITANPGSKTYGILSVLLQAFYDMEYLFTVKPGSFHPPPKVDSAVIRMKRNDVSRLDCDEKLFFRIIKQGFQNRRKTLRNALKPINLPDSVKVDAILDKRAEALGVKDFIDLTNKIERAWNR